MKYLSKFILTVSVALLFASCNKSNDGRIVVRLTDSPGDYEAVNIDLKKVQVHRSGGDQEAGWIDLDTNEGIYDLLELTNGVETVIADASIPAGAITQIRLVLGENNSVQVDGVEIPLTTPSAMQSGLKLIVDETLIEGITYSLLLDFDAAKSVIQTGNGSYSLKPVIKTVTEARDGAIEGTILPAAENVAVYAMQGEDTVATSYATAGNASWFLGGLEAGNYNVVFDPGLESTYAPKTIESVSVSLGAINDIGETELDLK